MNELLTKIINESATEKDFHKVTTNVDEILDLFEEPKTINVLEKFGIEIDTMAMDEVYIYKKKQ